MKRRPIDGVRSKTSPPSPPVDEALHEDAMLAGIRG
jgi:hypothetical protein